MRCNWVIAATALSVCGTATGQGVDPGRLHLVGAPVRDAGVYDLGIGAWRQGHARSGLPDRVIYDNTCAWTGGSIYYGTAECEDVYDDGRIPSTSDPGAPTGATDDNLVDSFSFSYCTPFATGAVDIEIAFFNNIGGPCSGLSPPLGFCPQGGFDFGAAAGYPLPGDPQGGGQVACWTVTIDLSNSLDGGFCLRSDGDGVFDGDPFEDNFSWKFRHNMATTVYGIASGPLIAGDPLSGNPGSCSYDTPCGADPHTGAPCGTGLYNGKYFWLNVDGSPVGGPPNTSICPGGASGGSDCYSFGIYPEYPWGSFHMTMTSPGSCAPCGGVTVYCTAKANSLSCIPQIAATGVPSQCDPTPFEVSVTQVLNNKFGLVFYGYAPDAKPFKGGYLCMAQPVRRAYPILYSGGNPPPLDCSGTYVFDFNAWIQGDRDPALIAGQLVCCQIWSADQADPKGLGLSDAVEFTICH